MDSMFVDEGFGSLDEDALEQALKALLQLTEGNRLVGIISHVSELKDQIDKNNCDKAADAGGCQQCCKSGIKRNAIWGKQVLRLSSMPILRSKVIDCDTSMC